MNKMIIGTLAGGVAFFLLGGLIYGFLLADFYGNNLGSATGIMREMPIFWALIISQFGMGALVTYVFLQANVTTAMGGLRTGAIFGILFGIAMAFDLYALTNWSNVTVAFVEPLVTAIRVAIAGAVIGWALGLGSKSSG